MEHNTERRVERQGGCGKKRRIRSENWSASETLQMLEQRKAIVRTSTAKGSDAWKLIAQQLGDMNPESQARSAKQVAQRWDTLVKVYVSIEEECCESGRIYGEVIDERQKRCKTEYRELWHELIAQGNPGKRRSGKAAVQADEAPGSGGSQAAVTFVRKFGEIAESFTEILDTIDRSLSSSERIRLSIVTGSNWEPEDDQGLETRASGSGLEKQQVETKAEVAKATRAMFDRMQSIAEAASASGFAVTGPFCLEVDQNDWSMVMQRLSTISQKYQEPSRVEVGADICVPNIQQQTNSAVRSSHNHNNSARRSSSSLYIIKTCKRKEKSSSFGKRSGGSTVSSSTFAGLLDIVPLSPESILRGERDELRDLDSDQVVPVFQETQ